MKFVARLKKLQKGVDEATAVLSDYDEQHAEFYRMRDLLVKERTVARKNMRGFINKLTLCRCNLCQKQYILCGTKKISPEESGLILKVIEHSLPDVSRGTCIECTMRNAHWGEFEISVSFSGSRVAREE